MSAARQAPGYRRRGEEKFLRRAAHQAFQVRLAAERIRVADRWVDLSPGMTVAAQVKTGKRRTIEFFVAPLLRYRSEAVRER